MYALSLYPPSQGPADLEAGLVGWGGLPIGARVSPGRDAFILWYRVGEKSPVVVGGSMVVGGAVREEQVCQEWLPTKLLA